MMAVFLDDIVASHRRAAAEDRRPLEEVMAAAMDSPPPRYFRSALVESPGVSVIAEVKRRSPSKGELAPELVPGTLAAAYEAAGAAAISVLTDAAYFGGSPDDIAEVRATSRLPLLRKDFTVDARDVCDARLMGADAVLLIVAALSDAELVRYRQVAAELGLSVLAEVHDEAELGRAIDAGADLVGVNQRDLRTFAVDDTLARRLAPRLPDDVVKVAESGIRDSSDVAELADAGYDAVLVGEALVMAADPGAAWSGLRGVT